MKVIPSIDLEQGIAVKRVRGVKGTGMRLGDPVRLAAAIAEYGFDMVHIVDLDGAETGKPSRVNVDVARRIVRDVGLKVQYGGGIRSVEIAAQLCSYDFSRLVIGSAWVVNPEILDRVKELGCSVLAAVDEDENGMLLVSGWLRRSRLKLVDALRIISSTRSDGILYTQAWRDGTLAGPDTSRVRLVRERYSRLLIYAGGVSSMKDVEELASLNVDAVVVGRALYEGRISWREVARYA